MDKRDRASLFRTRLSGAMTLADMTRSQLARSAGVDRSTIGQLLNNENPRLPNGQLLADLAASLHVSTDWLLGLTNRAERPGDIIARAMALSPAERSAVDEQILNWHKEATGLKVRHVPATLPDILKTDRMLAWEYASFRGLDADEVVQSNRAQLDWLRSLKTDYEIAVPLHEFEACAQGIGYYAHLDRETRREQLQFVADTCRQMFPRLRLFLFDAHKVFSAPITIYGPNLAVVYVGQFYLAFREAERVSSLTDHFDTLVREATVDARDLADYVEALIEQCG
ncbi:XRE family transcriptional regulator [Pseudovibrio japonicus]|uniref:XRE family transcriptional regulator n=1 Tax=Pseudovibrio japonicus TaxID=366534 RepID=A0ABQ3ENP6_9HYPH|nr:helix-turn-helix transcriptional regulator [Pseudovibrio japonicus]GHB43399.1 XRE family transcriptional regulator [Pseudovibrio japonicus]